MSAALVIADVLLPYARRIQTKGEVCLSWTVIDGQHKRLRVFWEEKNGPGVAPPGKTGFGTTLIRRGLPDAKVTREFRQ